MTSCLFPYVEMPKVMMRTDFITLEMQSRRQDDENQHSKRKYHRKNENTALELHKCCQQGWFSEPRWAFYSSKGNTNSFPRSLRIALNSAPHHSFLKISKKTVLPTLSPNWWSFCKIGIMWTDVTLFESNNLQLQNSFHQINGVQKVQFITLKNDKL